MPDSGTAQKSGNVVEMNSKVQNSWHRNDYCNE